MRSLLTVLDKEAQLLLHLWLTLLAFKGHHKARLMYELLSMGEKEHVKRLMQGQSRITGHAVPSTAAFCVNDSALYKF